MKKGILLKNKKEKTLIIKFKIFKKNNINWLLIFKIDLLNSDYLIIILKILIIVLRNNKKIIKFNGNLIKLK